MGDSSLFIHYPATNHLTVDKQTLLSLIDKYLNGIIDPEEEQLLQHYYNSFQQDSWDEYRLGPPAEMETAGLIKLKERIKGSSVKRRKPILISNRFRFTAAASILFLVAAIAFWYNQHRANSPLAYHRTQPLNDLLPGMDGAILTLADGSQLLVDSAGNGTLAVQGNTTITKNNGQLQYLAEKAGQPNTLYNTITTPKGRQFKLVLADGSRVWLNAASSIRFPTTFTAKERRVETTGEVYFEVAHNVVAPFKVSTRGMEVTVLGTHFNINAYEDEATIKTTLLEGAVKLQTGSSTGVLKPGEQASINSSGAMHVTNDADLEEVVAWKNGSFQFTAQTIQSIMRQISRWYDVEIVYEGTISKETFSGIVSRNSNVSEVMKILAEGGIKFKIEGGKMILLNN